MGELQDNNNNNEQHQQIYFLWAMRQIYPRQEEGGFEATGDDTSSSSCRYQQQKGEIEREEWGALHAGLAKRVHSASRCLQYGRINIHSFFFFFFWFVAVDNEKSNFFIEGGENCAFLPRRASELRRTSSPF
eukprot:gene252-126_t